MKFTLSWLKEHLDTDASLTEITDRLHAQARQDPRCRKLRHDVL